MIGQDMVNPSVASIAYAKALDGLSDALNFAAAWATANGIKAVTADDSIAVIRADYRTRIAEAMTEYLASDRPTTSYKGRFKKAVTESFPAAFYRGYEDAGGDRNDVDPDADEWLTSRTNSELGFVDDLFVALKQLRDQFWHGEVDADALREEVGARTDGYAATLDNVYGTGRGYGNGNQMLTYDGDDGGAHACQPGRGCNKWKGKRMRAKTWINKGLTDRNGNPNFPCGRWDGGCAHHFFNDKGEMVIE